MAVFCGNASTVKIVNDLWCVVMSASDEEEIELYLEFQKDTDARLLAPPKIGGIAIEFPFEDRWRESRIWAGYLNASLILLREMLLTPLLASTLIFPALFNFRHAVEVALKWHIQYAGGEIPKGAGHDLYVLVEAFRNATSNFDSDAKCCLEHMLARIVELASIDPRSITFRYSTELDGSPIRIATECLDLRSLYFVIEDFSNWLTDLSIEIDLYQN